MRYIQIRPLLQVTPFPYLAKSRRFIRELSFAFSGRCQQSVFGNLHDIS